MSSVENENSVNDKAVKREKGSDLAERLIGFAVDTIKFVKTFKYSMVSRHVAGQLLRSATSPGANYEEARGAESKADFIHKLGVVLKELKESLYWLRLSCHSDIGNIDTCSELIDECEELCAIIAKSILTARKNR
jgi:four helix bundle protein